MKQPAASSLTTSGASIPCNSPTPHMHTVTDFLSSSFLLPSLLPLHLLLKLGPTWVLFNLAGLYWRIVGNPCQAIECHRRAIHMWPLIHRDVRFVGSPTHWGDWEGWTMLWRPPKQLWTSTLMRLVCTCVHFWCKCWCLYGTCHKLLEFCRRNPWFAITEFRECSRNFHRASAPALQTGCGNIPTAEHFPRNTVVSRRRQDRLYSPGESSLATQD